MTQRPFKPFRLVMSSGQTYEVRHPEMAMLTRTDVLVGVDIEDDGFPARFKICSLLHVTVVEPFEPPLRDPYDSTEHRSPPFRGGISTGIRAVDLPVPHR